MTPAYLKSYVCSNLKCGRKFQTVIDFKSKPPLCYRCRDKEAGEKYRILDLNRNEPKRTLKLKIKGRIYSKKNSRRIVYRGSRRFFVPSIAFQKFREDAVEQIWEQVVTHGGPTGKNYYYFDKPVSVFTQIMVKGRTRVDGDNLHTSLLDILEAAKVIKNDNDVIRGGWVKEMGSREWGANIVIEEI